MNATKIKKIIMSFATLCIFMLVLAPPLTTFAVNGENNNALLAVDLDLWGTEGNADLSEDYVGEATGLTKDKDPRQIASSLIKIALGFLGIMAVVIILIGGFKWMSAGGNEEQVTEAKQWMYSGVVGLLIILASYALASFVLNQLIAATTTGV